MNLPKLPRQFAENRSKFDYKGRIIKDKPADEVIKEWKGIPTTP
jgi:hypothetical protein